MDQIVRRVLRFDRFALDLSRGYLRMDGRDIDLAPKPFEVLRHLSENAGRLVSKEELYEAVWPNVTVTDDSLVQCIRELRQKLGDDDHNLIKTMPRRGYLLDAALTAPTPPSPTGQIEAKPPQELQEPSKNFSARPGVMRMAHSRKLHATVVVAVLVFIGLGAMFLQTLFVGEGQKSARPTGMAPLLTQQPPASSLFSEADALRITALADKKQLPLPAFVIRQPAAGIPEGFRRFVGIWASDSGWIVSNRQFMLIVTTVEPGGIAEGYEVHGPAQPRSPIQSPAHAAPFVARISGDTLSYSSFTGEQEATLTLQDRIKFKLTYRKGGVGLVELDPVWTLVEAERASPAQAQAR